MKNIYFQSIEQLKAGQALESMRFDCDGDAVLCLVKQTGAACHTGREHCFYLEADPANQSVLMLSAAL